jgi:uncharacterized protein YebE (UPF0316 family)
MPEEGHAMPWFLPFLIFGARILDVSIGTLRVMFTGSGSRWIAAGLGFVELTIWALAVGGLVTNLTNPFVLIAYAGGFAAGTLFGLTIEDRLALGFRSVQVVNADPTVASPVLYARRATALRNCRAKVAPGRWKSASWSSAGGS